MKALDTGQRWYVAFTRPCQEMTACANLRRQGWPVFLPHYVATRRHARGVRTVRSPVFPRYVFVALDLDRNRWRSANGTYGVKRLVMADDRPLPVLPGVVETLMQSLDRDGNLKFQPGVQIGAPVRLASGPFADRLGILDRIDPSGRVEILLELLGGSIRVAADAAQTLPAVA